MGLFRKEEEYTQKMIRESGLEERKRKSKLEKHSSYINTNPTNSVSTSEKPVVSTTSNDLHTMSSQDYDKKNSSKKSRTPRNIIIMVVVIFYVLLQVAMAIIDLIEEETSDEYDYDYEYSTTESSGFSLADSIFSSDTVKLRFYSCIANAQNYYNSKRYTFNDEEFNVIFDEASGYITHFEDETYYSGKELESGGAMFGKLNEDYCFYSYAFTDDKYSYYISVEDDLPYVEVHDIESEDWGVYYFEVGKEGSFEEDYVSNNTLEFDESLVLSNFHIFEQEFTSFFGFNPVNTPKTTSEIDN